MTIQELNDAVIASYPNHFVNSPITTPENLLIQDGNSVVIREWWKQKEELTRFFLDGKVRIFPFQRYTNSKNYTEKKFSIIDNKITIYPL